jgi:protein-serine/threonine kinase
MSRDLKPENILLDAKHELLKITDFGVADVVRTPNDKEVKLSRGIAGSDPYIAPEMWEYDEYDALKADAWSTGNDCICNSRNFIICDVY